MKNSQSFEFPAVDTVMNAVMVSVVAVMVAVVAVGPSAVTVLA